MRTLGFWAECEYCAVTVNSCLVAIETIACMYWLTEGPFRKKLYEHLKFVFQSVLDSWIKAAEATAILFKASKCKP